MNNTKPEKKSKLKLIVYLFGLICCIILLFPIVRHYFIFIGKRWFYIFALSSTVAFSLTPACKYIARVFNILDIPEKRKLHKKAIPLLGGFAIYFAFVIAILINGIYSKQLAMILVSSGIIFLIGVLDDHRGMSAAIKLLLQLFCCSLIMLSGIILNVFPVFWGVTSGILNVTLTIIWLLGITNAMNFFDGMDGLAAGLGVLISIFLGVVAFQTSNPFFGWITVAMAGACIGFLPYNFKLKGNASIFLGDAGSTTIGYILACVAIYGEWSGANPILALAPPLLIFGVLIFDMVFITMNRIMTGKVSTAKQWIDYVGKDHLHHRLDNILGGKKKSVLFIYFLNICLGTSAIVLRHARTIDAILLIIQACIMVSLISILEKKGNLLKDNNQIY